MSAPTLTTERLILRMWRNADLVPFAELNADPRVAEFLPGVLSRSESDALATRIRDAMRDEAFGLWAVEVPDVAAFIGYVGLSRPRFDAHFTPCVEIGWRLARNAWGRGYATEAARTVAGHAFGACGLGELVSFTAKGNSRSRAVMERLGMAHDPADDFAHPALPPEHRLRDHVLYRLSAEDWSGASLPRPRG